MNITVRQEGEIPPSVWGGGSSRQLFIYPPESRYDARDFLVRMSIAETLAEGEAVYTMLPGITRHLLMLEGEARIVHGEAPARILKPLGAIDVFDGGLETRCAGKVKDFNLMVSPAAEGLLQVREGPGDILIRPAGPQTRAWLGLYCAQGEAAVRCGGQSWTLKPGGFLLAEDFSPGGEITLALGKGARLVQAEAWLKPIP